ncbi:acyl-[acyl-carrier-protein] thioesterase [Roseivirga sp. BDSF3-8]|uniref:acyl-[acyl-carrier-protein] thioesterase n=1 Tax=Roseivirga sp. BDSF3-8 TaxID=3241598 RepID=UPI00353182BE
MKDHGNTNYTHTFEIRPLETDNQGVLKPGVLTDMIQQAAWVHAEKLGVGTPLLIEKGYTWVLNRLQLTIDSLPEYPGQVVIKTWPSGHERLFTFRNFIVYDKENKVCATASSAWMIVDLNRKRAALPPDFIKAALPEESDADNKSLYTEKLSEPQNPQSEAIIHVRRQDIDINDHVNNNIIIQWLYECLDMPGNLKHLDIMFKAECKFGDKLLSEAEADSSGYLHHIVRPADGKVIGVGRTTWN